MIFKPKFLPGRHEFLTPIAAGSVNGSVTTPSGSTLTVVDTENKVTVADGKLVFAGGKAAPAYGDPGAWVDKAIVRTPGRVVGFKVNVVDVTTGIQAGLDTNKMVALTDGSFKITNDYIVPIDAAIDGPKIAIPTDNTDYTLAIILRSSGAIFLMKTGTGVWKRLWSTITNNTSTLYAGISNYNAAAQIDFIRPCNYRHLPPPILSDSFAGTDGSADGRLSDGLGHLETTGIGSGGAGVAWAGSTGSIASNRLVITPELGAELLTDGGFENWTSDTNLTSWTEYTTETSTVNKESSEVYAGSYACRFDVDAANGYGQVADSDIDAGLSGFYLMSVFAKSNVAGKTIAFAHNNVEFQFSTLTTNYAPYLATVKKSASSSTFLVRRKAATSSSIYLDSASVKALTLATCFQTCTLPTKDVTLTTKFTMVAGTQCGIVFGLNEDGTYFGMLYHNGAGSVVLEINENGTWTTKSTTAIAAGADAEMIIRRDDNEIWAYYGATPTLCGTGPTTTLSAGESSNLAGLKVGLFSTSSSNSFSSFTGFYTGSNGEIDILDRLIGA